MNSDYKKVAKTQVMLRLPSDFHESLKIQAEKNCRSLHSHILFLLYGASSHFLQEKSTTENAKTASLSRQSQQASDGILDSI